ncbi:MAG: hypothetical protein NC394_01150 [Bacteroides sp.]|nr:hypothetical protein [Bacteroides sp.]
MAEKKINVHEGHRQRVKERFLRFGIESFTDVQLLEALLFYAVPKKDTNGTAHLLLDAFGSFAQVLEADYEELMKISGIGENAASLLKFFQMASKRYLISSFAAEDDEVNKRVTGQSFLCGYCSNLFLGCKNEVLYAIALDNELVVRCHEIVSEGDPGRVNISARRIVEFALKHNCDRIALAHNHPNGSSQASRNDISATADLAELLEGLGIELIDHIIVGKYGAVSMHENILADRIWKDNYGQV